MRNRSLTLAVAAAFAATVLIAAGADATTLKVDPAHSSVRFGVRHLLSKTTGTFGTFEGTVELDTGKRDAVKVSGVIDVASLDTGDEKRDKHLRAPDFFDVATYPKIEFSAGKLSDVNEARNKGKLEGSLTMHGVTKPVVLDVEWFGVQNDPWGNTKAGFSATTTVNRKDFGISWNKTLDSGGFLIGEDVEIEINVEAFVSED